MLLQQTMDLSRIIQVYVIQLGVGGIFYFLIAYLVLRRSTKRLNQIFAMFFISVAIGTIINVIYASLHDRILVQFLNILTYFLFGFALIFLLLFSLMVLKSEKLINTTKQLLAIIGWGLLFSGLFFIGMSGGTTIDPVTWKPIWYLPFTIYALSLATVSLILVFYFSIEIHRQFENPELKKKWKFYLFGIADYYFIFFGTTISNTLAIESVRTIWAILSLIAILSTYTLYYGVAKQLEN